MENVLKRHTLNDLNLSLYTLHEHLNDVIKQKKD